MKRCIVSMLIIAALVCTPLLSMTAVAALLEVEENGIAVATMTDFIGVQPLYVVSNFIGYYYYVGDSARYNMTGLPLNLTGLTKKIDYIAFNLTRTITASAKHTLYTVVKSSVPLVNVRVNYRYTTGTWSSLAYRAPLWSYQDSDYYYYSYDLSVTATTAGNEFGVVWDNVSNWQSQYSNIYFDMELFDTAPVKPSFYSVNFTVGSNGTLSGKASWPDIPEGTTFTAAGITAPTPTPSSGYEFDSWSPAIPSGTTAINQNYTFTANFKALPEEPPPSSSTPDPPPSSSTPDPPFGPKDVTMSGLMADPQLPAGYLLPHADLTNASYVIMYAPKYEAYFLVYFYGNVILLESNGLYRIVSVDSSGDVSEVSLADSLYYDGVQNGISYTAEYRLKSLKPVGASDPNGITRSKYFIKRVQLGSYVDVSIGLSPDNMHYLEGIPLAVKFASYGNEFNVRYDNGAYYTQNTVTGEITLHDADNLKGKPGLPYSAANRWLTAFGYQPFVISDPKLVEDAQTVEDSLGGMFEATKEYNSMAGEAVTNVSGMVAAAAPVFTAVWDVLPGWVMALLAVSLSFVIGRKIIGR